jgi:hypothetical protein
VITYLEVSNTFIFIVVSSGMLHCVALVRNASVVPSISIFVTLTKDALRSSETSVLIRATWRNVPEDAILHSHRRGNLKSYMVFKCWGSHNFHRVGSCMPARMSSDLSARRASPPPSGISSGTSFFQGMSKPQGRSASGKVKYNKSSVI